MTVVQINTDGAELAAECDRLWRAFAAARKVALTDGSPESAVRAAEAFGDLLMALRDAGQPGRNLFLDGIRRRGAG